MKFGSALEIEVDGNAVEDGYALNEATLIDEAPIAGATPSPDISSP